MCFMSKGALAVVDSLFSTFYGLPSPYTCSSPLRSLSANNFQSG